MNCTTCWPPNLRKYLLSTTGFFGGAKSPPLRTTEIPKLTWGMGLATSTQKMPMKKCCPSRMDGGHQTFNDAKVFVHHLAGAVSKTHRNKTPRILKLWSWQHRSMTLWNPWVLKLWPFLKSDEFQPKICISQKIGTLKSCSFRLKLKKSLAWILSKLLQAFSNSKVPFP